MSLGFNKGVSRQVFPRVKICFCGSKCAHGGLHSCYGPLCQGGRRAGSGRGAAQSGIGGCRAHESVLKTSGCPAPRQIEKQGGHHLPREKSRARKERTGCWEERERGRDPWRLAVTVSGPCCLLISWDPRASGCGGVRAALRWGVDFHTRLRKQHRRTEHQRQPAGSWGRT